MSLTRFSFFSKGIEHLVPLGLLPVDGRDVYEPLEQPTEDDTKIFDARASREEYHDFFLLFLKEMYLPLSIKVLIKIIQI